MTRALANKLIMPPDKEIMQALQDSGLLVILREWACEFGNASDADFMQQVRDFLVKLEP